MRLERVAASALVITFLAGCGGLEAPVLVPDASTAPVASDRDGGAPSPAIDPAEASDSNDGDAFAESDADLEHLRCGPVVCEARTQGCCIPRGVVADPSCVPKSGPCDGVLITCNVVVDANGRHGRCDAQ